MAWKAMYESILVVAVPKRDLNLSSKSFKDVASLPLSSYHCLAIPERVVLNLGIESFSLTPSYSM
jgi:hypothetical protein